MKHTITLRLGDESNDGHGETYTQTVESNLSINELIEAFRKGSDIVEFDLCNYCEQYEDNFFPKELQDKLIKLGFEITFTEDKLYIDDYIDVWLFISKLGNQAFDYKKVSDERNIIDIGGYGLFPG